MSLPLIEVNNVTFAYTSGVILSDISLTINRGDFITIVGPNGGGKSTLLRLVAGLETPDSGTITVHHKNSSNGKKLIIGLLPQLLKVDLNFPATVFDVVLSGRDFPLRPTKKDRTATVAILERLKLTVHAQKRFSDLSGGQRQRVLLARSLVCEPDILVLDEPASSFDQDVAKHFWDLLQTLVGKVTILLVSHDLLLVSRLSDRVACVNRELQEHHTKELTGEALEKLFHGTMRLVVHEHHDNGGGVQ